jgi:hypothetical protein
VSNAFPGNGIFQRLDDMLLSNDFIPRLGAPFAVEGLGHVSIQYPVFNT